MKINHIAIDPQMEKCVSQVQWLVMSPAFKQTVTTTYCNREKEKNRNPLTKVEFLPKQVMKVHINELCLEITAKLVKRVKKSQMLCHFHFFFKMFRNTTNQQKKCENCIEFIPCTQYCRERDSRRFCHCPRWFHCQRRALVPTKGLSNELMHYKSKSKIRAH